VDKDVEKEQAPDLKWGKSGLITDDLLPGLGPEKGKRLVEEALFD
jgi:hypothetical protein